MTQQRIGRYEVLEQVAAGGQATVYRARDTSLGRVVALKVLHPHLASDPQYRERFLREARTAASLNHPNVVLIYEVGEDAGRHYIAMEFLPRSLHDVLRERGPLPAEEAVEIIRQVASALQAAHQRGIVHRDLKPQNILLTEDPSTGSGRTVAKVTDFGIARAAEFSAMTATGMVMGTPQYMSPEQARGERVDIRSDLYSLGIVLYETLTGHTPLEGQTPQQVLRHHIQEREIPLYHLAGVDVPSRVLLVLYMLLTEEAEARYATPEEAERELLDTWTGEVARQSREWLENWVAEKARQIEERRKQEERQERERPQTPPETPVRPPGRTPISGEGRIPDRSVERPRHWVPGAGPPPRPPSQAAQAAGGPPRRGRGRLILTALGALGAGGLLVGVAMGMPGGFLPGMLNFPTPTATATSTPLITSAEPTATPMPTQTPTPSLSPDYRYESNAVYGYTLALPPGWIVWKGENWEWTAGRSPGPDSGAAFSVISFHDIALSLSEAHEVTLDDLSEHSDTFSDMSVDEAEAWTHEGVNLMTSAFTAACYSGFVATVFLGPYAHKLFVDWSTCPEDADLVSEAEFVWQSFLESLSDLNLAPRPAPKTAPAAGYWYETNELYGYTLTLPPEWTVEKEGNWYWTASRARSVNAFGTLFLFSSSYDTSPSLWEAHEATLDGIYEAIASIEELRDANVHEAQVSSSQGMSLLTSVVTASCASGFAATVFRGPYEHSAWVFWSTCPQDADLVSEAEFVWQSFLESLTDLNLAPTPPPTPTAISSAEGTYIPSLDARTTHLWFFEGGADYLPPESRVYRQRFPQATTRYITYELGLSYPARNHPSDFTITGIYEGPDREIAFFSAQFTLPTGSTSGQLTRAIGSETPGTWSIGLYTVDLYRTDLPTGPEKIASGSFEIY